ncbi:MAG: azurin, partial [Bacteroidota bacterium]
TVDDPNVTKIVLEAGDNMQFNTKEIRVRQGQKVELKLTHTGSMTKLSMGHNFVLLDKGTNLNEFAVAAIEAKDNDYIPETEQILAHTKLLGGGESDTIVFEAPAAGTYQFVCSYPGHVALMVGKFIVS